MSDHALVRQSAAPLWEIRSPACPQMRSTPAEWLYPVEGYCILQRSPASLMIPTVEEFRQYCSTARFHQCPRYRLIESG